MNQYEGFVTVVVFVLTYSLWGGWVAVAVLAGLILLMVSIEGFERKSKLPTISWIGDDNQQIRLSDGTVWNLKAEGWHIQGWSSGDRVRVRPRGIDKQDRKSSHAITNIDSKDNLTLSVDQVEPHSPEES